MRERPVALIALLLTLIAFAIPASASPLDDTSVEISADLPAECDDCEAERDRQYGYARNNRDACLAFYAGWVSTPCYVAYAAEISGIEFNYGLCLLVGEPIPLSDQVAHRPLRSPLLVWRT